jgi:hypothetical protein
MSDAVICFPKLSTEERALPVGIAQEDHGRYRLFIDCDGADGHPSLHKYCGVVLNRQQLRIFAHLLAGFIETLNGAEGTVTSAIAEPLGGYR